MDDDLVRLICQRDEPALAVLIQRYSGQVYAICKRICKDELDAYGVVSDVFWEFWRNADRFRSERGSLRAYLLTMARSRAIDRQRSVASLAHQRNRFIEAVQNGGIDLAITDAPERQWIFEEDAIEVQQALCRLTVIQRQVLQLAFFDGLSHREVAQTLQLPLGTVKSHIRKALLRLKHLLSRLSEAGTHNEL